MKACSGLNVIKNFKTKLTEVIFLACLILIFPAKALGQLTVDFTVSSSTVCSGSSITFTDNTSNITGTPTYSWSFGTGSSPSGAATVGPHTVTYTGAGTITVSLTVTDDTGPQTVNKDITVNPDLPVSISIAGVPAGAVCVGTSVSFTASGTNGGTNPAYQWQVNGFNVGTNSADYSYAPANTDAVTCILTSNATCATGNPATSSTLTMSVNPNLPVSVSIAASPSGTVCAGTSVTFTATPVNGGLTPAYQWKVNGSNVGTSSNSYSYSPLNNDVVTCVVTSNAT